MISLIIKVKPSASRDEITYDAEGELAVKIKERPIDGVANKYLISFLAKEWKLRKRDIALEKGATSRYKKLLLNVNPEDWETILNRYRK